MSNATVLTVSQYLDEVNLALEAAGALVMGEVAEFRSQGAWVSFSLRDKEGEAMLKCVLPSWKYARLGVPLEDGMQVKVAGAPRLTKRYGSFGFWVEAAEPVGAGSLKRAYELLKKKLDAEGLFARKRALPEFVERIGVVSSKHGVVIHDFRKNLDSRGYKLFFRDARVEGADAVGELCEAIEWFNRAMPDLDVLLLLRGGGGLESMLAFNHEEVCRAVFASHIPIIAGIGHEVDVPLVSLVADAAVSTPTAAAHAVNATWDRALRSVERFDPVRAFERVLSSLRERILSAARLLEFADPMRNLRLGYALVRDETGNVIKDARKVKVGARVTTELAHGRFTSHVQEIKNSHQ